MIKKVLLILAAAALVMASEKNYQMTLFEPSVLSGTELKPGSYKVELAGDKVTLTSGKTTAQASVKVENSESKYASTSVRYSNGDGKLRIQEIRLGGTNTRLVVN